MTRRVILRWLGFNGFTAFLGYLLWLSVLWLLIYGGANWITSLHAYRVRLWTDAELTIPFIPAASAVYLSLFPMLWISPFVLQKAVELRALSKSIAAAILISAIGFILLPAEPGYPPQSMPGFGQNIFRFADAINLRYNMCPSLHVAMAVAAAYAYSLPSTPRANAIWWSWAAAIAASTLLTHQHHVVDVVAGALVGWSCGAIPNKKRLAPVKRPGVGPCRND